MRLLTLLSPALLAATAFAAEAESSQSSSVAASSSSSASNSASDLPSPAEPPSSSSESEPEPEPTPVGQLWAAQWTADDLSSYTKHCASKATHKAEIYSLGEMYPKLKTWAPELKIFYHRQHYPGAWEGKDEHGNKRVLMKMDYEDLPFAVREW